MIPLATTRISVLRQASDDMYAEPYAGDDTPSRDVTVTGVRAVIDRGSGSEQQAGGEQSVTGFRLTCDPIDLAHTDTVRDDGTQAVYRVLWVQNFPGDHTEAGLESVSGEV